MSESYLPLADYRAAGRFAHKLQDSYHELIGSLCSAAISGKEMKPADQSSQLSATCQCFRLYKGNCEVSELFTSTR